MSNPTNRLAHVKFGSWGIRVMLGFLLVLASPFHCPGTAEAMPQDGGKEDSPDQRPRLRDLGIMSGQFPPGPYNAITDVNGVKVGHVTLWQGEGVLPTRERTGSNGSDCDYST